MAISIARVNDMLSYIFFLSHELAQTRGLAIPATFSDPKAGKRTNCETVFVLPAGTDVGHKQWAEAVPPQSYRLMTNTNPAFAQYLSGTPQAQQDWATCHSKAALHHLCQKT
ncbi:hypothetical protein GRI39_05990 [Altererythrobacter indicus]|uniref:Uncharacterized protein n=1 Tax=Altericroceibacterium indicum TaxID=374177 RepID=A0A845A8L6_9SPHN|nr:hypothetical protein [Altericroceibacterium indicum]MXP25593.1 hypothetical protein [Altericroceibacterium indicum]